MFISSRGKDYLLKKWKFNNLRLFQFQLKNINITEQDIDCIVHDDLITEVIINKKVCPYIIASMLKNIFITLYYSQLSMGIQITKLLLILF